MGFLTDGGLNLNVLREANLARLRHFRNAKGELSHSKINGSDWNPAEWSNAVAGEVGELCNLTKKLRRGDFTLEEGRQRLADEMADVVIYLDLLAQQLGVDLSRAIIDKWNATSEKVGAPVRLDADDWRYTGQT